MSDLVGNPGDRFSRVAAHILLLLCWSCSFILFTKEVNRSSNYKSPMLFSSLSRRSKVNELEHISGTVTVICMHSIIGAAAHENQQSAYAKTKTQISFAVTAKLISVFVFAARIVQSLFFLNRNFKLLACFCDCDWFVSDGLNPDCWFSHAQAHC